MERVKKENIKTVLAEQIKEYIKIILKEYGEYIPCEKILYLKNIEGIKDKIHITNTGTITLYVNDGEFYFPEHVENILNKLKLVPGFGRDKTHKCYDETNLINNDNTYIDYMKHVHKKGVNTEEFYLEMLLHETLHFCGAGGGSPLAEGINEMTTRKLAQKYNLTTSGCGYPKEVAIACELEQILGKEIISKILFSKNNLEIDLLLETKYSHETYEFYHQVQKEMIKEFYPKYYNKSFPGIFGPIKKTKAYSMINYDKVYNILNDYKEKQKNKQKEKNKIEEKQKSKKTEQKNNNRKTIVSIHNVKEIQGSKSKTK